MGSIDYAVMPRNLGLVLEELYYLKETKSDLIDKLQIAVRNSNNSEVNFCAIKINEYYERKKCLKLEIESLKFVKELNSMVFYNIGKDSPIELSHLLQNQEYQYQPARLPESNLSDGYAIFDLDLDYASPLDSILMKSFNSIIEEDDIPTAEGAHLNLLDAIKKIAEDKKARSSESIQLRQVEEEYQSRLNKKKLYIDSKSDIQLKRWCKKLQEIYQALYDVKEDDMAVEDLEKRLEQSVVDLAQSSIKKVQDNPENLLREIHLFEELLEYVKPRLKSLIENERDSHQVNRDWDTERSRLEKEKLISEIVAKKNELIAAISFKKIIPYEGMEEIDILKDIQLGTNLQRAHIIIVRISATKWKTLDDFKEASKILLDELNALDDPLSYEKTPEYEVAKHIMEEFDGLKHRPVNV